MKTFTLKNRSEVDIRVSQEIKNYRDSLTQLGEKIQNITETLSLLSAEYHSKESKYESDRKNTSIGFDKLQDFVYREINSIKQVLGNFQDRLDNVKDFFQDQLNQITQNYTPTKKHRECLDSQIEDIDDIKIDLVCKEKSLKSEMIFLRNLIHEEVSKVRNDIPSIEEFKPMKQQMQDVFTAFKIDFEGLVKEITILKKISHYDQKKIENLYTLIDRLKERST